jgi:hypothetical protein
MIKQEAEQFALEQEALLAALPDLSVDDWNAELDQIKSELNQYLARELLLSTQFDEDYHFDKYNELSAKEVEEI